MKKLYLFVLAAMLMCISGYAASPSGTLPILYINIENGQEVVSKETYLNALYWLDPCGVEGISGFGSESAPLVTKIKGRGNYTFTGFEKKPYRLKLDKKAALCGMKSSKHFGLLAHADDNRGFLRNALGFKASEIVGLPWTPDMYPLELVVNGTYRGLYFLTELIRIDKDRVNISGWEEEDASGNPLSKWIEGGTLVEIDNYDEEAQIRFENPGAEDVLRFTYDKSVDPGYEPDGYIDWLKSSLGKVNDLILHGDRNSDELWRYVDIDDLARFITVQEFMDNYESFHGSCYLYRDLGDDEKWHFSPVWDFGSAFQRSHPNHSFYKMESGNMHYNHWVGELLEFPALRAKIAEYWQLLNSKRGELNAYAEGFVNQINSAAARDKERWPQYGNDNLYGKLNEVKGFMESSASFMNKEYAVTNPPQPSGENFYIVGSMTDWNPNDAYRFNNKGGVYEYTVTSDINGEWKINNGSWDINYGLSYPMNLEYNRIYPLAFDGQNITTTLSAGTTVIFSYNPEGESTLQIVKSEIIDPVDPIDPIDPSGYTRTVRFIDADPEPWEQVYLWVWDGANGENFTGGNWPGVAMTREDDATYALRSSSYPTWTHTFDTGRDVPELKMIFSNGNGKQTEDLNFNENYTRGDIPTSITDIDNSGLRVMVSGGYVVIDSKDSTEVPVYTLDGGRMLYQVEAGITMIKLPHGLYVVAGKKIVI